MSKENKSKKSAGTQKKSSGTQKKMSGSGKSAKTKAVKKEAAAVKEKKQAPADDSIIVPETVELSKALDAAERQLLLKPVQSWRTYIRRLLNEDGTYKRKYTYQVTLLAQSLRLLQECYLEIMKLPEGERMTAIEYSREGDPRAKEHPLVTMYIKIDSMCRRNAAALGMNMLKMIDDGQINPPSDPLENLMQKRRN